MELNAMDPKDELLAKLKAIDAEANTPAPEPELKPVSPPPAPAVETAPQITTHDFLAKLNALDAATRPTPPPVPPSVNPSTPPSRPAPSKSATASQQSPPSPPIPASSNGAPEQLPWQPFAEAFGQLKRYTQAQITARAAEAEARQKREAEIARAQTWLDELDPLSDDGFWFEQFAESYESRIQAALDFLNPGRPK